MASRLVRSIPEQAVWVRALCSWTKHFTLTDSCSLRKGVQMGTGEFNAEVTCQISDKYPNLFYMGFL